MAHTIMLIQPSRDADSRRYSDYESVSSCMEGILKIYEEHLRQITPQSVSITYDIQQLHEFISDLYDLSCLVYQSSTNTYIPHGKEWIKQRVYSVLAGQAAR